MAYIVNVTVPAGKVASTLTNFVTRVDLAHMPAAWWTDTTSDLGNVRVKSAGTVIPFDIVRYDRTAKTGELFFKATLTTSAAAFTVETVDGATALAVTDPNGQRATWSDYEAVFMLPGLDNRTGKGADGSSSIDLKLAAGAVVTSDGWLDLSAGGYGYRWTLAKFTTWTMGATGKAADTSQRGLLSYSGYGTADGDRASIVIRSGGQWGLWNSINSWLNAGFYAAAGTTQRMNYVHQAATSRAIYGNGSLKASGATVQRPTGPGDTLFVGVEDTTAAERFNGQIRSIYLRGGALSDDWLAAEYVSWETPASFYTVTDSNVTGSVAATLPALSANLSGGIEFSGTIAANLPALAANLDGTAFPPGIAGDLTATLPALGANLTGTYSDTATLAANLPPLSASLAGTVLPPPVTGALAATLPALRASIAGQAFEPGTSGYLDAVLPALSATFSGTVQGRSGLGLVLDSDAVLTVADVLEPEPTVPAGTPPTVLHIIAPTVPVPTLVAGRPQ